MDGYTQTTGDDNTTYFDHLLYLCNWDELFFTCNEPHTVIIEKIESFLIEELNCSIEYVRTNGSDSTEIKGISVSKYSIYKLVLYQNQFKKKKFHLTYIVDFEPIFSDNQ